MPTNLEIKARYPSLNQAKAISRNLRARYAGTLVQIDTYFKVKPGRLKLREINGKRFEIIYYSRNDARRSRYSKYVVLPLLGKNPAKSLFESLYGTKVVVKKRRVVFLYKNSRIHLDLVEGLGVFVEFEVLVTRGKRQAQTLMHFLQEEFGLLPSSLIAGSYSDLLLRQ